MPKKRCPSDLRYRRERNRMHKRGTLKHKPRWVSWQCFSPIYDNCPLNMRVDHIIPLKGNNVSGLHVPWNLQYLTKKEDKQKGNKYGTFQITQRTNVLTTVNSIIQSDILLRVKKSS